MDPGPVNDSGQWARYTVFDGLAGMRVEALHQDCNRYLWIATADGGVSRFDGVHFDNLTVDEGLPHATVMSIAEDADGGLWFATLGGGLAAYDGRRFRPIDLPGLPSRDLVRLRWVAGQLWVTGRGGLARLEGDRVVEVVTHVGGQPLGMVYDALVGPDGTTWVACMRHGVVALDGRRLGIGGADEPGTWPWMLHVDGSGTLWVATKYTGAQTYLYRCGPGQERAMRVVAEAAGGRPVRHGVLHVRSDCEGRLWIASRGVLVCQAGQWSRLAMPIHAGTLSDTKVTFEDHEGNLWVGFWGGGLAFCDARSLSRLTEEDGLPDPEVTHLARDRDGRVWCATMSGPRRVTGQRLADPGAAVPGPGEILMAMSADRAGRIWVGTDRGRLLCLQDPGAGPVDLPGEGLEVRAVCHDAAGRVWVGCQPAGLLCLDPEPAWVDRDLPWVQCLLPDADGGLWIGLMGGEHSLYRCVDGRVTPVHAAGLSGNHYVQALVRTRDGALWVGTGSGLLCLRDGEWRTYTTRDGLTENAVLSLAEGIHGEVWVGTGGGGVARCADGTFQTIRLGEAAAHNIVDAILVEADGGLWCGTRTGLVRYRPGDTPPRAVVRRAIAGRSVEAPDRVEVLETTPEVQVVVHGIGFRSARQMRYSYRLRGPGRDEAWSPLSARPTAAFEGLATGAYRFEARVVDRDGLGSNTAGLDLVVVADPARGRLEALEQVLREPPGWHSFVGRSQGLRACLEQIAVVASTDVAVLILGETGTGKGLAAHSIHEMSRRSRRPLIQVNCGALPEGVIESELFGYERGAFTGAHARRLGRFELADGGTLFLDEIGDLTLESQRVLLHVLEDKQVHRLGGQAPVPVDVRVVAATNRDLQRAVAEGTFRQDLYFRLSEFVVTLPPLRERVEDVPLLVRYFLERSARHLDRPVPEVAPEVVAALQAYPWPGNVRELEHVVQRAVLVCRSGRIEVGDVREVAHGGAAPDAGGFPTLDQLERDHIERALAACDGVVYGERGAAHLLGIHPERLRSRIRRLGLQRPGRGQVR